MQDRGLGRRVVTGRQRRERGDALLTGDRLRPTRSSR